MSASDSRQMEPTAEEFKATDRLAIEENQGASAPPTHIVGIGASAGGLEALERFFQQLPEHTGMAYAVVQHLSPDFKSLMDEVLARWTRMPIHLVEHQMPVVADAIYLMPPKTEMIISEGCLLLTARERSDELHLPIDQFFRSLAQDAGPRAVAIVLSGTGSDGSRGIRDIHKAGGLVLVQSPETAKFDGMPQKAIETEVAAHVLAPEEMPDLLSRLPVEQGQQPAESADEPVMTRLFKLLRKESGIDFSHYKPSTISRRTDHRVQLTGSESLEQYLNLVEADREELQSLYRDLLIGVTSFFRDPEAFSFLGDQVLAPLMQDRGPQEELRVWVAGCATGEEAYSVAILLHEVARQLGKRINAKVFATDVHARSLEVAAAGVYKQQVLAGMSPQRLSEFFTPVRDGFRVTPELRNTVVFAQHNLLKDAPFTRMDLICCRNLLIYFLPEAQNKVVSLLHFGLKTGGVLFLGPSEGPGALATEFQPIEQHWKLYRKRRDVRLPPDLRLPISGGLAAKLQPGTKTNPPGLAEVFAQALEQTLPPAVLVNAEFEILHTFGDVARYLRLKRGQPSWNLLDMLARDLRMAVGAALHRALREGARVSLGNIQLSHDSAAAPLDVAVVPLPASRTLGMHLLVQFQEAEPLPSSLVSPIRDIALNEATRDHIESLESELRLSRENLQATIEELETSNEELQATNEELLASNEELQSTNEELHSVNEELYTVNAEYQRKITELTELTHDMDNLLSSTDVHTIFLDGNLCIRRFTPKMAKVFNLISSDVGRNISGFMHSIECENLEEKLTSVLHNRQMHEEEVQSGEGIYFLLRILPYQGEPHQTGVVLTLVDITGLKDAETRFSSAMEVSPNGMLMVCSRGLITQANTELARIFGYEPQDLIGQPLEILLPAEQKREHRESRQEYFRRPYILRRMGAVPYVWGQHKSGREIPVDVHVRPISTPSGRQAIASVVDVSQHQQLEQSLREQVQQRDRFLATLSHELRNPMGAILSAVSLLGETASHRREVMNPCQVIKRQASQMALLLDDLLDVARVTQGKIPLRLEVVDLVGICRDSLEAVHPRLVERGHELRTDFPDQPVWVHGDRVRLLQIFENLLTNAIKYTDAGGVIELIIQSQDRQASICVKDNGRGMSAELIDTIFDMFVQSDDTLDRSEGGMGVGLTLVRALVEMHQGTITAHSQGLGQGSEFCVKLPLTANLPEPDRRHKSSRQTNLKQRIVYVEDDPDARDMLAALLRHYGHEVLAVADNGREALELIGRLRPSVAILDIGLPQLDGYQVARRIRQELGQEIYLIALTGYGRDEDHAQVIQSGFNHHLVKPVMIGQLDEVLRKLPNHFEPPSLATEQPAG